MRLLTTYTLAFLILSTVSSIAQKVDYNAIILPDAIEDIDISEKLVRLAWKNFPANEVAQHEIIKAKHNIGVAGSSWLNLITLQGNLNEFNIDPSSNPNPNTFYPRYNVGITIPLGIFMETPNNMKIAKENLKIQELNLNEQKLVIRGEVLRRYQDYLNAKELLKIHSEAENDAYNGYILIEEKFKSGEIDAGQFMVLAIISAAIVSLA